MFGKYAAIRLLAVMGLVAFGARTTNETHAAPLEIYEGIVVVVGKYAVTVEDPRDLKRRDFAVNQSTKIMRNGNLAHFADLQPGDAARITVRPLGPKLLALTITAMSPP
jgi:hypothetical protein